MNSAKSDLYTQITHIVDTSQWRDVEALTFLDNNLYSSSKGRGKVYKKPDATTPLVVGGTKSRHVQKCKLFFKYGILFSFIMTLILIAVSTLNNSIINYQHNLAAKPRSSDTTPLTLDDNNTTLLTLDDNNTTPLTLDDDDRILDGGDNTTPLTLDDDDRILDGGDNTTPLTLDDDDRILDGGDNTTHLTLDDDDRILDGGDNTTHLTLDDDDRILDDDNNTTPSPLKGPLQQVEDLLDRGIGDTANLIDNVVANSALEKKDVILVNKTVIIDATRNYIIVKPF
jgi:hypothetical protein